MSRRAERPSHRSPAGFFPVNALAPWVTMAGCSLHCSHCGAEGRAPLPRAPAYGEAVEGFLARHRDCAQRLTGGREETHASERRQIDSDSADRTTGAPPPADDFDDDDEGDLDPRHLIETDDDEIARRLSRDGWRVVRRPEPCPPGEIPRPNAWAFEMPAESGTAGGRDRRGGR